MKFHVAKEAWCFFVLFRVASWIGQNHFAAVVVFHPKYFSNHSKLALIAANCILGSLGPCGCRGITNIRVGTPFTLSAL